MKCKSGKHEWTDTVSAERCCDPEWRRELRRIGEHYDLDPYGLNYVAGEPLVKGWVKARNERPCCGRPERECDCDPKEYPPKC